MITSEAMNSWMLQRVAVGVGRHEAFEDMVAMLVKQGVFVSLTYGHDEILMGTWYPKQNLVN